MGKEISPDQLAYVIYTSGTTGTPKGTLIEHKNVVRLFFNDQSLFDFKATDVWCLFHSYYFDFSVWEIFGALLYGGKLVVASKAETKDLETFADRLVTAQVTVLNQTPTVFKSLQKVILSKKDVDLSLRYLIFGGEALVTATLKPWHVRYPDCKLINMYGITETTVHVTYKEITEKEINASESNIGLPIPTLGGIVLDQFHQLVPRHVVGELYVYGEGLARAYHNKPELTETRFVSLPIPGLGEQRVYKTGDMVKLNTEGDLVYHGRIDSQVKIRGHRIELGEIEHHLQSKPEIQRVSVLTTKGANDPIELVAYLEASEKQNASSLRQFLSSKIPEYAIPAYFVQLDDFPLTHNGKIDVKGLPDPKHHALTTQSKYEGARDETENILIDIFAKNLERNSKEISIHDNFFDLGANSLKLLNILNDINQALHTKLKPLALFQYTTINELVTHRLHKKEPNDDTLAPQAARPSSDEVFDFMED